MSAVLKILSGIMWLIQRFLGKKDANEPQKRIDDAKTASATGDDDSVNAAIDAARMQNGKSSGNK